MSSKPDRPGGAIALRPLPDILPQFYQIRDTAFASPRNAYDPSAAESRAGEPL
jgi:hypothetical protein